MDTMLVEIAKSIDRLYVDVDIMKSTGDNIKNKNVITVINDKLKQISDLLSKRFGVNIKVTYQPGRKIIYYKMLLPSTLTSYIPEKILKDKVDLTNMIGYAKKEGTKLVEYVVKKLKDINEPAVDRDNLVVVGLDQGGKLDIVINEDVFNHLKPSMLLSMILKGVNNYFYGLELAIDKIRFLRLLGEYYSTKDNWDGKNLVKQIAEDIKDYKEKQETLMNIYLRDNLVLVKLGYADTYLKTMSILNELGTISIFEFAGKAITRILLHVVLVIVSFVMVILLASLGSSAALVFSNLYIILMMMLSIHASILIYGVLLLAIYKATKATFVGLQFDNVKLVKEANNVKRSLIKELRNIDDDEVKKTIMDQIDSLEQLLKAYNRVNEYVNKFKLNEKDISNKLANNDLYIELEKLK